MAPPAGAVGRGDAFILAIADKSGASIFSNDSFQEFHGKYKWLFDDGRLIGGKAVPHVGWVFVERLPVRGPTSRRSVKSGTVVPKELPQASPEASKPMPVPKSPPPGARKSARPAARANTPAAAPTKTTAMANDVMPFLSFVEKHPVGTKVKAVVDTYAANGITVKIGDISGYVSLRNMATPPPRSARDLFKLGDTVSLMVSGYTPSRRSVDLGVPEVVTATLKAVDKKVPATKSTKKSAPAKSAAKKSVSKSVAKPASKALVVKATPTKAVAKKVVATKAVAKKATPAKAVAKKVVAKKAAPAKAVAKKTPAAKKPATKK